MPLALHNIRSHVDPLASLLRFTERHQDFGTKISKCIRWVLVLALTLFTAPTKYFAGDGRDAVVFFTFFAFALMPFCCCTVRSSHGKKQKCSESQSRLSFIYVLQSVVEHNMWCIQNSRCIRHAEWKIEREEMKKSMERMWVHFCFTSHFILLVPSCLVTVCYYGWSPAIRVYL